MVVGFKVEIYPNTEQEKYLLHCCHMYHDMWNFFWWLNLKTICQK